MLINNATLQGLRTTFGKQFQDAYNSAPVWWDKIATRVPSSNANNTYGWLAQQATLRHWLGPREAQNLVERGYVIENRSFEGTIEVDRDHIEDDSLGIYTAQMLPQLGAATAKHPDRLAKALLQSSTLGFDGLSLFNDSHLTYDKTGVTTTYDNVFTGTALTAANFAVVYAAMQGYVGEDGLPLGVNPTLLIVPPQLKKMALEIVNATIIAGANGSNVSTTNVLQGWVEVLDVPELSNEATTWYLADASQPIKPFIFQERRAPEFVSRDNPQDPKVFEQKIYTYGVDYRGEMGIALPFLIAKAVA
jgi:phage major head subunit gpT-like protein